VRSRLLILLGSTVVAAMLAMAVVKIPTGKSSDATRGSERFTAAQAQAFKDFPIFSLGSSFENLQLTHIFRADAPRLPGEPTRRNDVSFIYGSCTPSAQGGCYPPLQVQVWDACERYRDLYPFAPDKTLTLRGVPVAVFDDGRRLELYSGRVTIVMFGTGLDVLLRAAQRMRGVNNSVLPGGTLPKPEDGALDGTMC
jgi:hypothetical protein